MTGRPDEFALIEKYLAPLAMEGAFGLRDDAALLAVPKGRDLVVTTDAIAEGVHFLPGTDPALIARKAIRVNLSDLAAKGAVPFAISLALGLGPHWDRKWIAAFARGLKADCEAWDIGLSGGDTFRSPGATVVSVTAFGHAARNRYASRLGAKPGDVLFVTGTIGDAVLGLEIAGGEKPREAASRQLLARYELPRPRTELAGLIASHASAAMDISDGLVGDLEKLCRASDVAIDIPLAAIPFSREALAFLGEEGLRQSVARLITGGDDYELLVSVPAVAARRFEVAASRLPFPLTRLGAFAEPLAGRRERVRIITDAGSPMPLARRSYVHFGEDL